ncbi:MAG: class I SAM-dependent methyltransferase [Granulosicoccus sp.]
MKTIVGAILARAGFKLTRVPVQRPNKFEPSDTEIKSLESIIRQFTGQQTKDTDLADEAQWRSYLSNRRISFFIELVSRIVTLDLDLKNKRICDLGSGTGYLLREIHRLEPTAELHGFDTFEEVNQLAKMLCPSAQFVASNNPSDAEPFDLICCTQVLEHMVNPEEQLRALLAALNSGGYLILTVPDGRLDTHPALSMRDDGSGYWGHINFWSPESWKIFIDYCCKGQATFRTGAMDQGQNYAFIRKH